MIHAAQAELLPVVVALQTWAALFCQRHCIVWFGKDTVRAAIVRGYSPILESAEIVSACWKAAASAPTFMWVARVPSAANVADRPSRGQVPVGDGYQEVRAVVPDSWSA